MAATKKKTTAKKAKAAKRSNGKKPAKKTEVRECYGQYAPKGGSKPRLWTTKEIDVLKAEYGKKPVEEIMETLNRPRYSLWSKARSLGLQNKYEGTKPAVKSQKQAVAKKKVAKKTAAKTKARSKKTNKPRITKTSDIPVTRGTVGA